MNSSTTGDNPIQTNNPPVAPSPGASQPAPAAENPGSILSAPRQIPIPNRDTPPGPDPLPAAAGESGLNKSPSVKQIDANRRNSRRSTGPKTPNGKAVSRMNAHKHGILSKRLLACGININESPAQFKSLCRDLYASFQPVGPLESLLADQIAAIFWRLRRVPIAETGEIMLSVDESCWRRQKEDEKPASASLSREIQRADWRRSNLITSLESLAQSVQEKGELTDDALIEFTNSQDQSIRDDPFRCEDHSNIEWRDLLDLMASKFSQLRDWFTSNPEHLNPDDLRARHKADVQQYISSEVNKLRADLAKIHDYQDREDAAHQRAGMLPPAAALDKILRYEPTLIRALSFYTDLLELRQRRRLGEHAPSTITPPK